MTLEMDKTKEEWDYFGNFVTVSSIYQNHER